ncbi:MAG TPA: MFS transporter, partial [Syntrophomonas sp.]|nr:MFS transporter [Syntrophomonas sp.]
ILAGLGIFITAPVVIPSWFAYSATYLGIAAGCGGLGGMIGAPIISYFIKSGGYPAGFMFSAVVAAVVLIPLGLFVMRFKPEEIGAQPYDIERFQREQAAIAEKAAAAGGTGAVFNGYSEAEVRKMPHWWLLWVFVALLPFLNGVFMHVPGALGDKGLDVILVGTVLSFYQFGVAGGQFIIGWFSEKLGVNATLYLWAAIAVVTAGGLAAYNQPVVAVLASLVFLLGLIRALTTVGLPIIVKTLFGMKDYSKIFSSYYTVVMWAGAIYITVQGWLRDTTGSYNTVFMIISGIAVVLLILLFIIMSMGKAQEQKRLSGEWKPMQ